MKNINKEKRDKTKIRVGNFVTAKVGKINDIIREGEIIRMRKYLVAYVQASSLKLPCNSIYFLLSSYLATTGVYCSFSGALLFLEYDKHKATPYHVDHC